MTPESLAALETERAARVRAALGREGIDALVLLKSGNVRYAAGARSRHAEGSREAMEPVVAIVIPGADARVSEPGCVDDASGAARLAGLLRDGVPSARRIAIDRLGLPLRGALRRAFPDAEIVDADTLLGRERMVKLPGEIDLLREGQERNERAIRRVLERLRPGVREIDLTIAFHEGLAEIGVTATHVESVWCAAPRSRGDAPWTFPGGLPYRELTSERVLGREDVVIMDTGILHEGYMSDFGRTWPADPERRPSDGERRVFEEWCSIRDRLFAAARPGNTALDLRRAALAGWKGTEPPWPLPLYVAHSLGLGGVEPPFAGTDLGEAVEELWQLEPGMVIVFEPYVWRDGCGHRAEETVVVTESGCERFTRFPYGPFDS